jgi:hypothetical protein
VTTCRIHCQVLEVPAQEEWLPRHGGGPRDLLPWADPYISSLVRRLEERFDAEWDGDEILEETKAGEEVEEGWALDPPSARWREDAFRPPPIEASRFGWNPTVCGGFPLLDDCHSDAANER